MRTRSPQEPPIYRSFCTRPAQVPVRGDGNHRDLRVLEMPKRALSTRRGLSFSRADKMGLGRRQEACSRSSRTLLHFSGEV